jgi:hypothetical protein
MLRRDLAPLDTYLADATSLEDEAFIDRYPWPVLITPAPSPELRRQLRRRPDTVVQAAPTLEDVDPMAPGMVGACLDALCLLVRPLDPGRTRMKIGRAPNSDVVLIDESVSRQHAELDWDRTAQRSLLKDLGTKNGTYVDQRRLEPDEEAQLMPGCLITFGALVVRYYSPRTFRAWLATGAPRSGASPSKWPRSERDGGGD